MKHVKGDKMHNEDYLIIQNFHIFYPMDSLIVSRDLKILIRFTYKNNSQKIKIIFWLKFVYFN